MDSSGDWVIFVLTKKEKLFFLLRRAITQSPDLHICGNIHTGHTVWGVTWVIIWVIVGVIVRGYCAIPQIRRAIVQKWHAGLVAPRTPLNRSWSPVDRLSRLAGRKRDR